MNLILPRRRSRGNDAYTKILLHFDGTNGSQTYTDTAAGCAPHTWTAQAGGALSTSSPKRGSAAYSNIGDSTSCGMTAPDSDDFTLGAMNWTIDFWCNPEPGFATGASRPFGQIDSSFTTNTRSISASRTNSTGILGVAVTTADGSTTKTVETTSAVSAGSWSHIAVVRTGKSLLLFLNGTLEAQDDTLSTDAIRDSSNQFGIGRAGELGTTQWRGGIDEFRLSVGIARWTANFTPPTSAYS